MTADNEKEKFTDKLTESLEKDTFVKITFGKYKGGDKDFKNIFVSRIDTKQGERLSFKFRYATKDIVKNYDPVKDVLIEADPLQMREVCHNIMNNAYDAISGKAGKIVVSASECTCFMKG